MPWSGLPCRLTEVRLSFVQNLLHCWSDLPPYLIQVFPLDPQYMYQISARLKHAYANYSVFCKACEMLKKKKRFFLKICWLISREWLEWSYSNFECGLPCKEANCTLNLVPFGEDIMELATDSWKLRLCSCQYTHSIYAHPVFLGHTTHYHVFW